MLNIIKNRTIKLFHYQLFWIQICTVGIWLLGIQNYFGRKDIAQDVNVVGGNIDADVRGYVDVNVSGLSM